MRIFVPQIWHSAKGVLPHLGQRSARLEIRARLRQARKRSLRKSRAETGSDHAALQSFRDSERGVEDVLKLGAPDQYSAGNPVVGSRKLSGGRRRGHGAGTEPMTTAGISTSGRSGACEAVRAGRSSSGRGRFQRGDFGSDLGVPGELTVGSPIPVTGIRQVAFENVHDSVRPAAECRGVVLHDLMRGLPLVILLPTPTNSHT